MLSVFPEPYDDELIYGVISRLMRAAPFRCSRSLEMTSRSPFGLCSLDRWLANFVFVSPQRVIERLVLEHSLLPYRLPCLLVATRPFVFAELLEYHGFRRLGHIIAMGFGPKQTAARPAMLRFCPTCATNDRARVGEAYWHRAHQLPCTALCLEHDCRLIRAPLTEEWMPNPPCIPHARREERHSVITWPYLRRLASLDAQFLTLGSHGFAGEHLARAIQENPLLVRVPREAAQQGFLPGTAVFQESPWKDVINDPNLPLVSKITNGALRFAYEEPWRATPAAVILLLALRDIDPTQLLLDPPQLELIGREVDTCGSRFCPGFRVTWLQDAFAHQAIRGGVVFAQCSRCGFRARVNPTSERPVIAQRGSAWAEFRDALADEGILGDYERRRVLELGNLSRLRSRSQDAPRGPYAPTGTTRRKGVSPGARGSIDGPHFRTHPRPKRRPTLY